MKNRWKKIFFHNEMIETVTNSCGKMTIYSKINYQLPVLCTGFDIMCQISSSSKCGNGVISKSILLQINIKEGIYLASFTTLRTFIIVIFYGF